jgi:hydrogenase expression/formation protein HypC
MCLGVPGQIVAILDEDKLLATVAVCGIQRQVNVSCVLTDVIGLSDLLGSWVLVHVGFAMSLIDEAEARDTLLALEEMGVLADEATDFAKLGQI